MAPSGRRRPSGPAGAPRRPAAAETTPRRSGSGARTGSRSRSPRARTRPPRAAARRRRRTRPRRRRGRRPPVRVRGPSRATPAAPRRCLVAPGRWPARRRQAGSPAPCSPGGTAGWPACGAVRPREAARPAWRGAVGTAAARSWRTSLVVAEDRVWVRQHTVWVQPGGFQRGDVLLLAHQPAPLRPVGEQARAVRVWVELARGPVDEDAALVEPDPHDHMPEGLPLAARAAAGLPEGVLLWVGAGPLVDEPDHVRLDAARLQEVAELAADQPAQAGRAVEAQPGAGAREVVDRLADRLTDLGHTCLVAMRARSDRGGGHDVLRVVRRTTVCPRASWDLVKSAAIGLSAAADQLQLSQPHV